MGRWKADPSKQLGTTAAGPMTVRGFKVNSNITLGEREAIRGDLYLQERALRPVPERRRCPVCREPVETMPHGGEPCRWCGSY